MNTRVKMQNGLLRQLLVFTIGLLPGIALAGNVFAQQSAELTHTSANSVTTSGILKIMDSVNLPAERPGVLVQLLVREGEIVKKGQIIARLKSDEHEVRLHRAKLDYDIAKKAVENDVDFRYAEKSLEVSKADLQRSLDSNDRIRNSVPLARIEQQQLQVHRNQLQLEQAQRDRDVAEMKAALASKDVVLSEIMVSKSRIVAPMDGMVVAVEAKPGEWVEPGKTVLKVVRINRLKLEGFVSAEQASRIKIGDAVQARLKGDSLGGDLFEGKVVFKNPEANPVNSNIHIWVEVDNQDLKLTPGLRADMEIKLSSQ